jgi:chemotaxis protein CheD
MLSAKLTDIFLMPGDCFVGDARHRIRTLVGSCVAMTLWHPRLRVGAISHFLLPGYARRRGAPPSGTYGVDAMVLLVRELARLGVPLGQCQGKLFGGGAMFSGRGNVGDIGLQNGECARRLMIEHGVHVVSESLFGEGHRQVIFNVASGEVLCRQVHPATALAPMKESA